MTSFSTNPNGRRVVLCDPAGHAQGTSELAEAHRSPGMLHRAYSVFLFCQDGRELLIQKRHDDKLFGSLWANSCCSHPRPDEPGPVVGGQRRLVEELGVDTVLTEAGTFVYQAEDARGRGAEHEHDTVLVGHVTADVQVRPAPSEVADWKWIAVAELERDLQQNPDRYAPWLAPGLRIAACKLGKS